MNARLPEVLATLRAHAPELRRLGVRHAGVFGSVARGEAGPDSDIDVLVELDPELPIGVFEYARLKLYVGELLGGAGDVVSRASLKPLLRDHILRESVHASRNPAQRMREHAAEELQKAGGPPEGS